MICNFNVNGDHRCMKCSDKRKTKLETFKNIEKNCSSDDIKVITGKVLGNSKCIQNPMDKKDGFSEILCNSFNSENKNCNSCEAIVDWPDGGGGSCQFNFRPKDYMQKKLNAKAEAEAEAKEIAEAKAKAEAEAIAKAKAEAIVKAKAEALKKKRIIYTGIIIFVIFLFFILIILLFSPSVKPKILKVQPKILKVQPN